MNLSRLFAPIALVSAIALSGISGSALADTTLRIGVTPVPHADIVNFIKPTLEKEGVKLEVVEFNDYIQPNLALDAGELDANYFQTIPYLEEMVKSRGLNLHILVSVHLEPMALYSKKVKSLADIPAGAKVAVPSDPTNEGRALKVLEHAGLIKLKDGATLLSGIGDIVSNPKKLKFVELEAAQVPRSLKDVDIAVVNSNYALGIGLNPLKDSIYLEDKRSPYALVVATRKGDQNDPRVQKLVKALQSPATKKFILTKYKGAVVPSF